LAWLWYLSLDFQLFLMSPVFVFLLKKFHKKAVIVMSALIVAAKIYCYFEARE
jgi:peptidoglycan/LPS O-acetylase OafA/YrhL